MNLNPKIGRDKCVRPLNIGKLAREAGVHVETVRFYERRGFLKQPSTRKEYFRVYLSEAVRRIQAIKHAQSLGFSLKEIKEFLTIRFDDRARRGGVLAQIEEKIAEVEGMIDGLLALKRSLQRFISAPGGEVTKPKCSVLDALVVTSTDPASDQGRSDQGKRQLKTSYVRKVGKQNVDK